ncbi:response regulator transcription factor [Methylomarinum vadi]|uniref:response regulator transcription factor n=1 Tax=Methylomarinum vadi TaxID=438855 RepID=UPI0004DFC980|nr:response regulator transcription factor [Methylomarinum vadi]
MIPVYIFDSDDEIRSAAAFELAAAVVCDNEIQLLNAMEEGGGAIILLNYAVRQQGTAQFIKVLKKANFDAEIVVIGQCQSDEELIDCIMAGANGYQNIETLGRYVEKMLRVIETGEAWISRRMVARLLEHWRQSA